MATAKTKTKVKCEFDKESMYSKIMPTAMRKKEEATAEVLAEESEATRTVNEAVLPIMDTAKEKKIQSTSGIHIVRPENQTVLINVTEYAVNKRINEAFAKFKCCKCDRCMKDVAAIALNKLPTKYMVIEEDRIDQVVEENATDVIPALVAAVMAVKTNPRH